MSSQNPADQYEQPDPPGAGEQDAAPMPGWNDPTPRDLPQDPKDPRAETLDPGEDDGASADAQSFPGSTDLLALRARTELAVNVVAGVLGAGTGLVNHRLAQFQGDATWIMDEEDERGIAIPLGRVLARNAPLPDGGEHSSDIADLIMAGIGALAYMIKNINRRTQIGRAITPQAPAVNEDQAAEEPAAPAPPITPLESLNGSWVR